MERPKIIIPDKLKLSSWADNLSFLKSQEQEKKWLDRVEIKAKTTSIPYFLFCPLSDIHIGASGTDYEQLDKYVMLIRDYGVQTALIGDLGDFFMPTKIPEGMLGQTISVGRQVEIVKSFLNEIKEGLLCLVSGNHDDRFYKTTGFDIYSYLASDLQVPLLSSGGVLSIQVNEIPYNIRLFHKIARLNSQFNYTHAGKQALRLGGIENLDMVISADKHLGGVETTTYGDRQVVVAQLGTFKIEDDWSKRQGFPQKPQVFFPVFALDGRKRNIEYFANPDSALEFYQVIEQFIKNQAVANLGYGRKKRK